MGDIYYLRHNGEQFPPKKIVFRKIRNAKSKISWRISLTEMENIVHTQSRPYNPNSNPGPELPLSYEASVAQPPFLPPSDNFTTLAMNKKGNIFRPSLSLFYLFWFLLTFSALHSYPITSELKHKSCVESGGVYLSLCWHVSKRTRFKLWPTNERRRRGGSRPMRSEERVQSVATTCCPYLNPCSDFCGKSLVFHGHWCHMQT